MANPKIVFDDFIKHVKPDPKSTESILYLTGWIGESLTEEKVRVYFDIGLNQWADIAKADILHSVANTKEESSTGGSKLWIRKTAPASSAAAASFLEGSLVSNFNANMFQPGGVQHRAATQLTACPVISHCSPCLSENCGPSLNPFCGFTHRGEISHCFVCLPVTNRTLCCPVMSLIPNRCPVHTIPCRVVQTSDICTINFTVACPSVADGCPTAPTDPTITQNFNPAATINQRFFGTGVFNPFMQTGFQQGF